MHKDSRGYWYHSKRSGGRITKEYIGRGEWCALAAQLDESERHAESEARDALQARHAAIDGQIEALCAVADRMVRETLEAAGYHQHARSQWRKRREHNK
jgi:hypothetical protein